MSNPDTIAPEFQRWCDERVKTLNEEYQAFWKNFEGVGSVELPETLYHYTSEAGLRGILESKKIWATQIAFLNDQSEFVYGLEHASMILSIYMKEHFDIKDRTLGEKIATITAGHFSNFLFHFKNPLPIYVACFSEKCNSLNQWRSYADSGSGYSIGFSRKTNLLPDEGPHYLIKRVEYDREKQETAVRQIVDILLRSIKEHAEIPRKSSKTLGEYATNLDHMINTQLNEAFRWMYHILLRFKHPGFEEEREWRFVYLGFPDDPPEWIKYRGSEGSQISYIELPLHLELETVGVYKVESIRFGPAQKDAGAKDRAKNIAESLGYPDVKIDGSYIPWKP